ncbi:MAG TPA: ABC transporter substrate-binding protein [Gaiellaceae bacterium]
MDAARQRLAQAGRLAACAAVVALLAGCGSSSAPRGGQTLRLALPLLPRTLDPAKAADLPSMNVAHELYAGLTRFTPDGVAPDLAKSWTVTQGGRVWIFRLRHDLHWSDDRPITADAFRRSWLRALRLGGDAPLAGPDLGIVRGARSYLAGNGGDMDVEAVDPYTLRVRLQHPVPWFDELVAYPIAAPVPPNGVAFSGPFRIAVRHPGRIVLERNFNYWNAPAVKPSRLVLTTSAQGADAVLPRGLSPPGLPWIDTAGPTPKGSIEVPTLTTGLLWFVTRGTPLAERQARLYAAWALTHLNLGSTPASLIPPATPGAGYVNSHRPVQLESSPVPLRLNVFWAREDLGGSRVAEQLRRSAAQLARAEIRLRFHPVATRSELLALAGPPARPGADIVLLGWSSKVFDAYNTLDLFPCGSAFNIARWCDPAYDAQMRQAVRTLDDQARWRIERQLVERLHDAVPAIPVYNGSDYFSLRPGVHGFSWSPVGLYELMGMTRS